MMKKLSRRQFLQTTAGAAGIVIPLAAVGSSCASKPSGPFGGVDVGAISYSFRSMPGNAEDVLGWVKECGLTAIELMGNHAEAYVGAPEPQRLQRPPRGPEAEEMSEEELAAAREAFMEARRAAEEETNAWRRSAQMSKFEEIGAMYREANVLIDILKLGSPNWEDDLIDYAFTAAKAVGARGICFEVSNEGAEAIAPFADKHNAIVALHHHMQVADEGFSWDIPLSFSENNMINFDVGHFYAATGESPMEFIQRYHSRISHLHMKDRKFTGEKDNLPWGEGETPLVEILQLLQQEKYPIPAMIELEYQIPDGSNAVAEVKKCADFCKAALA